MSKLILKWSLFFFAAFLLVNIKAYSETSTPAGNIGITYEQKNVLLDHQAPSPLDTKGFYLRFHHGIDEDYFGFTHYSKCSGKPVSLNSSIASLQLLKTQFIPVSCNIFFSVYTSRPRSLRAPPVFLS